VKGIRSVRSSDTSKVGGVAVPESPDAHPLLNSHDWRLALQRTAGNRALARILTRQGPLGQGEALEPAVRERMEARFGMGFHQVRIHRGAAAAASAVALGARAYSRGDHIVFGPGRYLPDSSDGRRLLAHELAHVVQNARCSPPSRIAPSSGAAEHEATRAATAVAAGQTVAIRSSAEGAVALDREPSAVGSTADAVAAALNEPDPIAGVGDYAAAIAILGGISSDEELLNVLTELDDRAMIDLLVGRHTLAPQDQQERLAAAIYTVKLATAHVISANDQFLIEALTHLSRTSTQQQQRWLDYVARRRFGSRAQQTIEGAKAMLEAESGGPADPTALQAAAGAVSPSPWNPPGSQPIPFYIGNEAHVGIAASYATAHPADVAFYNFTPLSSIISSWTHMGNTVTGPLDQSKLDLKPDITNLSRRHLYEIKLQASQAQAVAEASMYAGLFLSVGIPMTLGPTTEPGTTGTIPAPGGVYLFRSPQSGAITYQYRRARVEPVPVKQEERAPERTRRFRFELRPLTPQEQAVVTTITFGTILLIMAMILLAPVGA